MLYSIYSLSKSLSYYYVLGTRDPARNWTDKGPVPWSLGPQEEYWLISPWVQIPCSYTCGEGMPHLQPLFLNHSIADM